MSILSPPKIDALQPVLGAGRLPANRRRAYQALSWPSFSVSDADYARLKDILDRAQTDFLEDPENDRIFVLSHVRTGHGLSPVADWMHDQVRERQTASGLCVAGNG